ncbi:MAG: EI24 domain-containing protein [Rickettsiales bacterium]|nr:EI24 domain-containing protein [Pseudomonadota bacterium]MDA0966351.1 EI24 domain-containing protein [Pseudomonadota bacterium]MDG4543983.1 EI24 domain-containing protein [Rickettsiales bacterium]MDG4545477.1 EI24 domain-containing protein [Rickettsiales bacterium]MDG4547926.1 EI24 domain-containing protein [Rickettsiales bacterium]
MIDIIKRSIVSITSAGLIRTSVTCLLITAVILGLFIATANFATSNTQISSWGWGEKVIDYILNAGAVLMAWFLFPIVTPVIASFFVDKVASEIERRDYPGLLSKTPHKLSTILKEALNFMFIMLILNIICLPFYLIPVFGLSVYYLLNSYLISREFFEMAAGCYLSPIEAKKMRRGNRLVIVGSGFVIILISNTPVLNLFAPIISITIMVHLFFKLYKQSVSTA